MLKLFKSCVLFAIAITLTYASLHERHGSKGNNQQDNILPPIKEHLADFFPDPVLNSKVWMGPEHFGRLVPEYNSIFLSWKQKSFLSCLRIEQLSDDLPYHSVQVLTDKFKALPAANSKRHLVDPFKIRYFLEQINEFMFQENQKHQIPIRDCNLADTMLNAGILYRYLAKVTECKEKKEPIPPMPVWIHNQNCYPDETREWIALRLWAVLVRRLLPVDDPETLYISVLDQMVFIANTFKYKRDLPLIWD